MSAEGLDCWDDYPMEHGCICGNDCAPPAWHSASAERAAEQEDSQKHAERIARQMLENINTQARAEYGGTPNIVDVNPNALKIATMAALAALNERD